VIEGADAHDTAADHDHPRMRFHGGSVAAGALKSLRKPGQGMDPATESVERVWIERDAIEDQARLSYCLVGR
jgi:hypothetical protein